MAQEALVQSSFPTRLYAVGSWVLGLGLGFRVQGLGAYDLAFSVSCRSGLGVIRLQSPIPGGAGLSQSQNQLLDPGPDANQENPQCSQILNPQHQTLNAKI